MKPARIIRILVYFIIAVNFFLIGFLISQHTGKAVYDENIEYANITKIIDGDTLDTDIGRVRLLGINTPEKKEKGWEEAKSFLENYNNRQVKLIYFYEDKDKYDRKLRYVFYNNENINKKIIEQGLAHIYYYNNDNYKQELETAEEKARKNKLGIWEKSKNVCADCIMLKELNSVDPGEFVILENICNFNCNLNLWIIKDDASNKKTLNFTILANENYKIDYEGRVWNDAGDSLYLRDKEGFLVIFYRY